MASHVPANAPVPSAKREKTGFLHLSAEICNAIYSLALVRSEPIKLIRSRGQPCCYRPDGQGHERQPPLLSACRQIRNEATAVFYGDNVFSSDDHACLQLWWKDIGEVKRSLVTYVRWFMTGERRSYVLGALGSYHNRGGITIPEAQGACRWFETWAAEERMPLKSGVFRALFMIEIDRQPGDPGSGYRIDWPFLVDSGSDVIQKTGLAWAKGLGPKYKFVKKEDGTYTLLPASES